MNDLIVREIMNGMLFMLGLFLTVAMGVRLVQKLREPNWRADPAMQAIVALFVFLIGDACLRSGWIWVMLSCQNEYGRAACNGIAESYEVLLVASVLAIVGATCCIRVFSPPSWCPWTWLAAGALAIAIPIGVHLF